MVRLSPSISYPIISPIQTAISAGGAPHAGWVGGGEVMGALRKPYSIMVGGFDPDKESQGHGPPERWAARDGATRQRYGGRALDRIQIGREGAIKITVHIAMPCTLTS